MRLCNARWACFSDIYHFGRVTSDLVRGMRVTQSVRDWAHSRDTKTRWLKEMESIFQSTKRIFFSQYSQIVEK